MLRPCRAERRRCCTTHERWCLRCRNQRQPDAHDGGRGAPLAACGARHAAARARRVSGAADSRCLRCAVLHTRLPLRPNLRACMTTLAPMARRADSDIAHDAPREAAAACPHSRASPAPSVASVDAVCSTLVPMFMPPALTAAELAALACDPNALKIESLCAGGARALPPGRGQALCDAVSVHAHAPCASERCKGGRPTGAAPPLVHGQGLSLIADAATPAVVPDASSPTGGSSAAANNGAQLSSLGSGANNKRRGPRSATSKFRGVSCYKRCAPFGALPCQPC